MTRDSRATGQAGEQYAAAFLRDRGYRVIASNVRYRLGEIDLVADDHGTLVFVEVRARKPGRFGTAVETLTRTKRARVVRAVELYLASQSIPATRPIRIDVVAVTLDANGDPTAAELIQDAFGE